MEHLVDALAVVAHLTNIAVAVAGALWEIAPARACFAAVTFAKMKRFIPIWTSWLDGKVTTMAGCCTTATLKTANIITGGKTSLNAEWNINGNATHTLFRMARTASLSRLTCTYACVVNANLAGAAVVDVGTLDRIEVQEVAFHDTLVLLRRYNHTTYMEDIRWSRMYRWCRHRRRTNVS